MALAEFHDSLCLAPFLFPSLHTTGLEKKVIEETSEDGKNGAKRSQEAQKKLAENRKKLNVAYSKMLDCNASLRHVLQMFNSSFPIFIRSLIVAIVSLEAELAQTRASAR